MPIPNTKGKFCTSVEDMEIGDYIACKYTASNGAAGEFSDLGAALSVAQANEIPVTSSATPNGYFYFIKADTGILIADRNVQHSVSWATLNAKGYIEGFVKEERIMPISSTATTYEDGYPSSKLYDNIIDGKNVNGWWNKPGTNIVGQNIIFTLPQKCLIHNITIINGFLGIGVKNFSLKYSIDGISYSDYGQYIIPDDGILSISMHEIVASDIKISIIDSYRANNLRATLSEVYINHYPLSGLIRSLDGGISYIDANGNSSLTQTIAGAFPANNEWDKYIEKSDLNGKIVAGDEKVWNHLRNVDNNTGLYSFVKNKRGANAIARVQATQLSVNYNKAKIVDSSDSFARTAIRGFRPVLQLLHPKQTNFYY